MATAEKTTSSAGLHGRDDDADGSGGNGEHVPMSSVRILDLRLLGQDEIRSIARLCGDVPARLRDLVRDLAIDKSIFNESLGGRRQTFDRERERERERGTRTRDHHHRHQYHLHHHRLQNVNESRNLHGEDDQNQKKHGKFLSSPSCAGGEVAVPSSKGGLTSSSSSEAVLASSGQPFLSPEGNLAPSNTDFSSSPLAGSVSLESFGVSSHRELILHLSQQLRVAERKFRIGNGNLYQKENQNSLEGDMRPVRMKSIARASSTPLHQVHDPDHNTRTLASSSSPLLPLSSTTTSASVNGRVLTISSTEMLHRVSKKMKPKDEARRKASFITANSQAEDTVTTESGRETDIEAAQSQQEEKVDFLFVPPVRMGMEALMSKEQIRHSGSAISINAAAVQCSCDQKSHETQLAKSEAFVEYSEPVMSIQNMSPRNGFFTCFTCSKIFSNAQSLKRHARSTGHEFNLSVVKSASPITVKKQQSGRYLCITCGNYYATPFTLKRHALSYGHSFEMSTLPIEQEHGDIQEEAEDYVSDKNIPPAETKVESHSLKRKDRELKSGKDQRRFSKKQQYIHDLDLPIKNTRTRPVEELLGRTVGSSSNQVEDKAIDIWSRSQVEETDQFNEPKSFGRQINARVEEVNLDKPIAMTCEECGKVFNEYCRYTGHLGMHSRFRRLHTGEVSFGIDINDLKKDIKESSALGFRRLISSTRGTYLSGLPAKLLFTGA